MSHPADATIRLMLVDDHPLVRDGLRARLEGVPGFAVVAEAGSAEAALGEAARTQPDLVLMDIGMRGVNGIEATRRLKAARPALHVVILSMFDTAAYVQDAVAAGAGGYVLKDSPADEIVCAIRTVVAGGQFHSPALAAESRQASDGAGQLTPREKEVLALIGQGLSSREIGERLAMGVRTVETHRTHLRRKLGLHSPAALVRFAVEQRTPRL